MSLQSTPSAWGFALRATTPQDDPTGRSFISDLLLIKNLKLII